MRSISEIINGIVQQYKAQARYEVREGGISTNKAWITASRSKVKRGPPAFLPTEGSQPETSASVTRRQLDNVLDVLLARTQFMETATHFEERGMKVPVGSKEYEARKKAILKERDISPVQLASIYGYTSDRPVRELRARHGLDENSGRPLKDDQRPIVSPNRKRQRKVRGKR